MLNVVSLDSKLLLFILKNISIDILIIQFFLCTKSESPLILVIQSAILLEALFTSLLFLDSLLHSLVLVCFQNKKLIFSMWFLDFQSLMYLKFSEWCEFSHFNKLWDLKESGKNSIEWKYFVNFFNSGDYDEKYQKIENSTFSILGRQIIPSQNSNHCIFRISSTSKSLWTPPFGEFETSLPSNQY